MSTKDYLAEKDATRHQLREVWLLMQHVEWYIVARDGCTWFDLRCADCPALWSAVMHSLTLTQRELADG